MGHTDGPWKWVKNFYGEWRLVTPKNGLCTVMDFVRKGMQGAQPRFSDRGDAPLGGIMHAADYYGDINSHPDARLIAAAPDLLAACKNVLNMFGRSDWGVKGWNDLVVELQEAVAKAEPPEVKR